MYGKLINGNMSIHNMSNPIRKDNGNLLLSNDPDVLAKYGYKELIYTTPEVEEGYVTSGYTWVESENAFTQVWSFELAPEPEPTVEERLEAMETAFLELIQMICGGDI